MASFKEGELILTCKPYAYALNNEFKNEYCDFCFKPNDLHKICTRCTFSFYCDKSCQRKAWETHKTECKYIKNYVGEKPDSLVRCIALIIFKIKKNGVDKPFVKVDDRKVSFATLMSHAEDIKQDVKAKKKVEQLSRRLEKYIGSENTPSLDELIKIYGKCRINNYTIISETDPIGCGLYLGASVFNHSCKPDALCCFNGTTLNVRMIRNVPHRFIDQVRISYVEDLLLTEERQKLLNEQCFFQCKCEYCTSPEINNMMKKLLSNTDEVKEKALQCQKEFKEKEQRLINLLYEENEENPPRVYKECVELLKTQSNVFADTNIYKIKTTKLAFEACVLQGASKADKFKLEMASSLETSLKMCLDVDNNNNNAFWGYFLHIYGEYLYKTGFHKEGKSKMKKADKIYRIAFGEQHPLYKKLNTYMDNLLDPVN